MQDVEEVKEDNSQHHLEVRQDQGLKTFLII